MNSRSLPIAALALVLACAAAKRGTSFVRFVNAIPGRDDLTTIIYDDTAIPGASTVSLGGSK